MVRESEKIKMRLLIFFLLAAATAYAGLDSDGEEWFRSRLLREALVQAESFHPDWQPEQRDCAGFVRFLFRKAAGRGEPLWQNAKKKRAHFVSAAELVANNFQFLSRSPERIDLRTGDLLVYKRTGVLPDDAWHLMVVLKPPQGAIGRNLVIYHNGDKKNGQVRKLWLDELTELDAGQWRAERENPSFQGVYRWRELQR